MADEPKRPYSRREESDYFDPIAYAKEHFPDDPFRYLTRYYDRRVVQKGERSIFNPRPLKSRAMGKD